MDKLRIKGRLFSLGALPMRPQPRACTVAVHGLRLVPGIPVQGALRRSHQMRRQGTAFPRAHVWHRHAPPWGCLATRAPAGTWDIISGIYQTALLHTDCTVFTPSATGVRCQGKTGHTRITPKSQRTGGRWTRRRPPQGRRTPACCGKVPLCSATHAHCRQRRGPGSVLPLQLCNSDTIHHSCCCRKVATAACSAWCVRCLRRETHTLHATKVAPILHDRYNPVCLECRALPIVPRRRGSIIQALPGCLLYCLRVGWRCVKIYTQFR